MTAVATETAPRKPRYLELAEDLRGQILSGGFPDADHFPTENVLCARYGVSRFTVREALRTLQNEGLIQRRRGSGTVIQPAAARGGALHQPLSNVGEILQYAHNTSVAFARDGSVALPRKLAEEIGINMTGRWARFHGVRTSAADDRPIAVTDAYIHPDLIAAADAIDPAGTTIFRQLETLGKVKIARVTQDIQAVPASARIAVELGVTRRSPCLRILRCYCDSSGRVIEISASHHPGDRFAYNMHIEVEG
ncbi:MAG: GntR family transcriptional regulator [Proteobacteria bacterium]|nr:GntR family transcriptional regulator [Pseudomonadota bacterium]